MALGHAGSTPAPGTHSTGRHSMCLSILFMQIFFISFLDLIACIGSVTAVISILPQIIQSYRTKSVNDVSMLMLLNLTVASVSWTIYGAITRDVPLFLTNLLLTVGSLIMVILKRKYHSDNVS